MSTWNDIKIEIASDEKLFKMAMAVRRQVFVKEQKIPENKEFDGNDFCATHVVAYIQKRHRKLPIGTMRIRFFADFVKFERMAVTRNFRKSTVAQDIMQYGFDYAAIKGYKNVYGMCKQDLLSRWEQCGYYAIDGADKVEFNGMTLIPIKKDLPSHSQALTMTSAPSLLVAPEGHWFDEKKEVGKEPSKFNKLALQLKQKRQKYFNF